MLSGIRRFITAFSSLRSQRISPREIELLRIERRFKNEANESHKDNKVLNELAERYIQLSTENPERHTMNFQFVVNILPCLTIMTGLGILYTYDSSQDRNTSKQNNTDATPKPNGNRRLLP